MRSGPVRRALFFLVAMTLSCAKDAFAADSALVVLVRPRAENVLVDEAITRIKGELIADDFEVSVADAPPGSDPISILAQATRTTDAAVTLGMFLEEDATAAELWVVDELTQKTVVRRVGIGRTPAGNVPEVLARRAVELLRASLLEILLDARKRKAPPAPGPRAQASRWVERALEPSAQRFGVEAGVQVLGGFGGVGAAVLPVARLRAALDERWRARLTLSGLGTNPEVEAVEGTATIAQEFALLELVFEMSPAPWIRPAFSLGAGAYHIEAEGNAAWPYAGIESDRYAFAADAGLGFALPVTSSFAIAFEGHALLVTPYPVIRFLGVEKAETGRPIVTGGLALVGWL